MTKKLEPSIFKMPYLLLTELRYGITSLSEICDIFQKPPQNMRYWLKKLCGEGFLVQPCTGYYRLTISGKKIHDQYERFKGKQLIRIENMHVSYTILENYANLVGAFDWRATKLRNNVKIYTTKAGNHTIRRIVGKSEPVLEVIVTKVLHVDLNQAYHNAIIEAERVVWDIEHRCKTEFSEAWVSGKPEIAIPSPIASSLLNVTGTSQIRTNNGIMNRSKGRFVDWEVTDLQQAQRIVNMPEDLEKILEIMYDLKEKAMPFSNQQFLNLATTAGQTTA